MQNTVTLNQSRQKWNKSIIRTILFLSYIQVIYIYILWTLQEIKTCGYLILANLTINDLVYSYLSNKELKIIINTLILWQTN